MERKITRYKHTKAGEISEAKAYRNERIAKVKEYRGQGKTLMEIAFLTGLSLPTVQKYSRMAM